MGFEADDPTRPNEGCVGAVRRQIKAVPWLHGHGPPVAWKLKLDTPSDDVQHLRIRMFMDRVGGPRPIGPLFGGQSFLVELLFDGSLDGLRHTFLDSPQSSHEQRRQQKEHAPEQAGVAEFLGGVDRADVPIAQPHDRLVETDGTCRRPEGEQPNRCGGERDHSLRQLHIEEPRHGTSVARRGEECYRQAPGETSTGSARTSAAERVSDDVSARQADAEAQARASRRRGRLFHLHSTREFLEPREVVEEGVVVGQERLLRRKDAQEGGFVR